MVAGIPVAVTIAGSDSGGGAGIQADIKTFSALGVYAASVITALTAQNTCEVAGVAEVAPQFVRLQMQTVAKDMHIHSVKIGMLANKRIISEVAKELRRTNWKNIVLDPVLLSQGGAKLLAGDAISSLIGEIFPLSCIVTPNIPESAALLGIRPEEVISNIPEAAASLRKLGAPAVLIKGGHSSGVTSDDWLLDGSSSIGSPIRKFSAPRQDTTHTHGSGCTLSSAICAYLARGHSLPAAVEHSKKYVTGAITAGKDLKIGKGNGPLHHFYRKYHE